MLFFFFLKKIDHKGCYEKHFGNNFTAHGVTETKEQAGISSGSQEFLSRRGLSGKCDINLQKGLKHWQLGNMLGEKVLS